jgi:hypothetical protein
MTKIPVRRRRERSHSRSTSEEESSENDQGPTRSSSSEEEIVVQRKKKTKSPKKAKKCKYYDNSSDNDELPEVSDHDDTSRSDSPLTKPKKRRPLVAGGQSAVDIVPYTEEQIRRDCKYKRHTCQMAEVTTPRLIMGQDACKPGKPAELAVDKVKLHYVVHYIFRGAFDHFVPEEGEREGKIDFYTCNVCPNKRFKNHLERAEYPGRGSVLCHIATDHGRLLKAMLDDENDMKAEIKNLAKYDKQFNEQVCISC